MNHVISDFQPLNLAAAIYNSGEDFIFLYSSLLTNYSGRYSYLAYSPLKYATDISQIKNNGRWFGYLSYETFASEDYNLKFYIDTPKFLMAQFKNILIFDHQEKKIYTNNSDIPQPQSIDINHCQTKNLYSNMSKNEYYNNIEKTREAIIRGDFYQANITRKFYGTLLESYNTFAIFSELCQISPAPYSAFLKLGKQQIISSSPEMFLKLSTDGRAENNLIKGSAPRFLDHEKDQLSKINLQNSNKDKSENIMIVDLMRNDFARGSYPDSIKVENLYKIYSYKTIHHALSTVISHKKDNISSLQFLKNCFPAGSITGAPKIAVMKWCRNIEKWSRGIYTGSIGWLQGDGSLDFSVAIRTIIIEDNKFEFQVGGAILYESTPLEEWNETLIKATAMAKVLGIDMSQLRSL